MNVRNMSIIGDKYIEYYYNSFERVTPRIA